jgi:CRP/FNR family nitrogen fixation transcriptional regulator
MNAIALQSLATARPIPTGSASLPGDVALRLRFGRDEEIFGEGEASGRVYQVIEGAVRTFRMLSDGRRQIVEFHTAGDVFGLDGHATHALGAEAVGECLLQAVLREAFLHEQGSEAAIGALLKKFQRAQAHMLLLGRHTACERVAAFLLDFQERAGADVIDLPMSRQDIADYLGLTIETVSRTLTQLQHAHQIDLIACRRVILLNPEALERICE